MDISFDAPGSRRPRSLRVCQLTYSFYDTDNRVSRYTKALAKRGDEVDVVALRRHGQARVSSVDKVRVTRLQYRSKTETRSADYLFKIAAFLVVSAVVVMVRHMRRPYDVIHVHNVPDCLVLAALLPKFTGSRVILDIHDILPELFSRKFGVSPTSVAFRVLLWAERASCAIADHVIVANHLWRDRLVKRSVPAHKCSVMLNYPDLSIFHSNEFRCSTRKKKFVVLYPGSLSRHQGVKTALKAFALVCGTMQNAEFHIYGEGAEKSEICETTRELGLQAAVRIYDPVPLDEIAVVMRSADVGIEPKLEGVFSGEAMSVKALEFMASGVPLIISRTPGHEYYINESLVRYFTAGDERELAEALVEAYSQAPSMRRLRAALEFARASSWERRVGDYWTIIDSLAGRQRCEEVSCGDFVPANSPHTDVDSTPRS
jgi:glycosyltransferase involved in cell wall biosynthesis